jgi:hypothetical protein
MKHTHTYLLAALVAAITIWDTAMGSTGWKKMTR